jgi:hypothetical protein
MVWMAELSDAARHSEMVSQGCDLVGVEQTVVCGLDADSRNEPTGFAARLARRLGWRLSLVPLPEAATEDERWGRLFAAAARDRAGFVVTEAARTSAGRRGVRRARARRRVPSDRSPAGDARPRDRTDPLRHLQPRPVGCHRACGLASRRRPRRPSAGGACCLARLAFGVRRNRPARSRVACAPHAGSGHAGRSGHR